MAFQPFVTSLDPADFQTLLGMIEGKFPDKNTAAHVCIDAASFAAGQLWPDPSKAVAHYHNILPLCQNLGAKAKAAGFYDATAKKIDWGKLLQIILQLLAGLGPVLGGAAPAPAVP
jgi:hypothetical protein